MNKKRLLLIIIFLFFNGLLSAQTFNLRHYSDFRNGFRGVATAMYIDNIRDVDLEYADLDEMMQEFFDEIFEDRGRRVDRITRNNQWLARQALNEWDLEDGDIFLIVCAENRFSETVLVLIALIEEGGENFRWWARTLSMSDLE